MPMNVSQKKKSEVLEAVPEGRGTLAVATSYILSVAAVLLVFFFHLTPAVLSGLAVYVLTVRFAGRLPATWGYFAHGFALMVLSILVAAGLSGVVGGMWFLLNGEHGVATLFGSVVEVLANAKQRLPESVAGAIPVSVDSLKSHILDVVKENGAELGAVGAEGIKAFIHILFGAVIGGMMAMHHFSRDPGRPPLARALYARSRVLAASFERIVFAQLKIALLNTAVTTVYLVLVLPLFGVRLPLVTVLVPLTLAMGMIPVAGNLVSNAAIVCMSLSVSLPAAVSSLVFLVCLHKLEYFTSARIVGTEVRASAWELLAAMLVMEAVFGVAGIVAAPVVYAWLKAELIEAKLI